MPDTNIDGIILEVEATTDKADKGLNEVIKGLQEMRAALDRIDTKKLKKSLEPVEEFEKRLQGAFQNIKFEGNTEELKKQIAAAEARLDSLLRKENKLLTVGGVDENSRSFRNLQYDIAEVCNQLDVFYAKLEQVQKERPLNFWERPEWTDRGAQINADSQEPQSLLEYAANDVKQAFADIQEAVAPVADSVRRIGEEMRSVVTETDNARQKMESMGSGGGFARLIDNVRSFSASDALGRMSAAVRDFQTRLGTRVPTEQYIELAANIQQAEAELQRLLDKQDRMEAQGISASSASWKGLQYDIRVATDRVADFNRDMELLQASGGDSQHLNAISYAFKGIANGAKSALNAVKRAGSVFKSFFSKVRSVASSLLSAGHGMSRFNAHTNTLAKSLSRVTTMLRLMVMRLALRAVLNNVGEGFKQLARESMEFNSQISNLMAGCKQLAYSIAALAAPIVNLLGPALTYIIGALTRAVNVVNQFLSALGGKSVYNKAKKQNFNYAESLDQVGKSAKKMAKEIRDATTGIDELNIISKNDTEKDDTAAGGGSGSGGDYYDTEPIDKNIKSLADRIREILKTDDWSEIGRMIAAKLNEAMAAIPWEKIQAEARRIAHGLATLINGFVDELDWELLGYTIGQGINTAVLFANTLLETINWGLIGSSIATALNSLVNTVDWKAIGRMICNGFNAAIDLLYEFVTTFDFKKFGESIGTALTTAIKGIKWSKAGQALGKAVTGLFEALNGIINKTDWGALGSGIVSSIGGFFKGLNWGTISKSISSALKGLLNFITGAIKAVDWSGLPSYIVTSIGDFFKNFDWSGVSRSLGELLGAAVKGAIELAGSIWDMLKEAWGDLKSYFSEYIEEAGGNIIEGLWNGIKDALKNAGKWIKDNIFTPFIDGFKEAFGIASPSKEMKTMGGYIVDGLVAGIKGKFSDCMETVKKWAEKVKEWFFGNGDLKDRFAGFGQGITEAFANKVNTTYTTAKGIVTNWGTNVREWFNNTSFGGVNKSIFSGFANDVVSGFREKIGGVYDTCRTNITKWASDVKDYFTGNGKGAVNNTTFTGYANSVITGFREKIGSAYDTCRTNITKWASDVKDHFTNSGKGNINSSNWATYANNVITGFREKIGNTYDTCRTNITKWASDVISTFKGSGDASLVNRFRNAARNVVDGFSGGITDFLKSSIDTVKGWADSLVSALKNKLGIKSPSRVFAALGVYTVEGFNKGIESAGNTTSKAIKEWTSSFSSADIGMKLSVDDSKLRNYTPNYGEYFENQAITQRVTREFTGALKTSYDVSGGIKEAFAEAIRQELPGITSTVQDMAQDMRRQANKKEQTIVEIGRRTITDVITTQRNADGFQFQPT